MTGGGTKSQYIMTAAVVTAMTLAFLSFYNLYCNFAVFMEMEIVQLYLQMQGMSSSNSNENLSTQDEDGDSCFEDINQILSMDTCFDFHDNVWDRLSSGRHNLHPSFWESDNIATCINEDYELIGLTHGVHILVGAQPIVLGRCPIIAVDSIPGLFDKQVTLVPSSGFLSENQKKRFLNFHNQMTLAQFREAVVNARISTKETSSSYNFMSNNCATFPLDILSWLGIDFKGVHREAVTTLVLKGLMSSKETTDKVMSVIRDRLRGKVGGTVWATLNSEKAIFQRVISIYIDEHTNEESDNYNMIKKTNLLEELFTV